MLTNASFESVSFIVSLIGLWISRVSDSLDSCYLPKNRLLCSAILRGKRDDSEIFLSTLGSCRPIEWRKTCWLAVEGGQRGSIRGPQDYLKSVVIRMIVCQPFPVIYILRPKWQWLDSSFGT